MSFHVSEDIGDYRIVSIIGAGSMGQVFQVEHRITRRKEALKVLAADHTAESQVQRFKREIEVQARLDHPNIARVHNALHLNDSLVLVMEFVEGESLEKKLQKGTISRSEGIDYICQTLSALEYAHQQGVVHRDVTPGNLIVDQNGHVKLTDFGVAKSLGDYHLTNAGEIVGSLYYMPPEQVRSQAEPDPRSDIYSTGAVLYEVLTGQKLFACADRLSLMVAQVQQQPIPPLDIDPQIGSALNAVVLKALAKDPAQRYQSAKEFLEALQPLANQSIRSVRPQHAARSSVFARVPFGAVALTALALAFPGGVHRSSLPPAAPLPAISVVQPPQAAPVAEPSLEPVPAPIKQPHQILRKLPVEVAGAVADRNDDPTALQEAEKTGPAEETAAAEETNSSPEDSSETTSEPVATDQPQVSPSHHKRFWSRLNPFKRRKVDPETQKAFTQR